MAPTFFGRQYMQIANFGNFEKGKINDISFKENIFHDRNLTSDCKDFQLDTFSNRFIKVITLDSVNRIIEGELEFTAINQCQDTVRITDGYFKVSY